MARGVDGRDIFIDDVDRVAFHDGLIRLSRDLGADILAFCLMGNHFHIAIQIGPVALASIMQRLLTSYSLAFNRRHNRTGHLFQARYKAIVCRDERYLASLIRYIHLNPVRAGLVARAQDWRWSSIADGPITADAEADLGEFDPWPKDEGRKIDLMMRDHAEVRDIVDIGVRIASLTGIAIQELRSDTRRRPVVAAKRLLAQEALRGGHPPITIARWLNVTPSSMTRYARENTANTGKPDTIIISSR